MKRIVPPYERFTHGERVVCVAAGGRLTKGRTYTVADLSDLGPPTVLVELIEFPGLLFHPMRFERAVGA